MDKCNGFYDNGSWNFRWLNNYEKPISKLFIWKVNETKVFTSLCFCLIFACSSSQIVLLSWISITMFKSWWNNMESRLIGPSHQFVKSRPRLHHSLDDSECSRRPDWQGSSHVQKRLSSELKHLLSHLGHETPKNRRRSIELVKFMLPNQKEMINLNSFFLLVMPIVLCHKHTILS